MKSWEWATKVDYIGRKNMIFGSEHRQGLASLGSLRYGWIAMLNPIC